jgi:hypothetical protein
MMDAADLGAAICDLAEVTSTLMELFETEQAGVAKREITAAKAAEHVKNWQSSSSFAVYHLRSTMARDLRKAYYAGPTWTSETVRRFTPGAVTKLPGKLGGSFYCRNAVETPRFYRMVEPNLLQTVHYIGWLPIAQQPEGWKLKINILNSMSIDELWSMHEQVYLFVSFENAGGKSSLRSEIEAAQRSRHCSRDGSTPLSACASEVS